MTSREAFVELCCCANNDNPRIGYLTIKYAETILKDLMMLETIKEWLLCFYDEEYGEFASCVELNNKHCLTEDKRNKIKEWLEK